MHVMETSFCLLAFFHPRLREHSSLSPDKGATFCDFGHKWLDKRQKPKLGQPVFPSPKFRQGYGWNNGSPLWVCHTMKTQGLEPQWWGGSAILCRRRNMWRRKWTGTWKAKVKTRTEEQMSDFALLPRLGWDFWESPCFRLTSLRVCLLAIKLSNQNKVVGTMQQRI